MSDPRLAEAIARIDAANSEDPTKVLVDGREVPAALLYGQRMSAWIEKLRPEDKASDLLKIAARAQHLRRWEIPRNTFPAGRRGYLDWRKRLYAFHAEKVGEILKDIGYDEEFIENVQFLVQKKCLATNWDVQTLEDAACLVFLEHDLAATTAKTGRNKMIRILEKTWAKMTELGHQFALKLDLPPDMRALLEEALGTHRAA